jgi:hypothetical protein
MERLIQNKLHLGRWRVHNRAALDMGAPVAIEFMDDTGILWAGVAKVIAIDINAPGKGIYPLHAGLSTLDKATRAFRLGKIRSIDNSLQGDAGEYILNPGAILPPRDNTYWLEPRGPLLDNGVTYMSYNVFSGSPSKKMPYFARVYVVSRSSLVIPSSPSLSMPTPPSSTRPESLSSVPSSPISGIGSPRSPRRMFLSPIQSYTPQGCDQAIHTYKLAERPNMPATSCRSDTGTKQYE